MGRKLDFIVQEIFRETNTMCSKANDSVMLKDLVDVKQRLRKSGNRYLTLSSLLSFVELFRFLELTQLTQIIR